VGPIIISALESAIKVAEIDDRDKIQIWDFIDFSNKKTDLKMFWDSKNKKLFFLDNEGFYISESLLK